MQIKEIVIYGKKGEKRIIEFNLNKVNIIEGGSRTGKTALISIIDYCLGSSKCEIPHGTILDYSSWFGLLIEFKDERIFIARKNPYPEHATTNACYFERGNSIESPADAPLKPNATREDVKSLLTQKIGISQNLNVPEMGKRTHIEANIRHTMYYCFQSQDEIINKYCLFHKQALSDYNQAQTIKDTLLYFLGAVDEDRLNKVDEKNKLKRQLTFKQNIINEKLELTNKGISIATSLLSEAIEWGLIKQLPIPDELDEIKPILEKALEWVPDIINHPDLDRLSKLQENYYENMSDYREKKSTIEAATTYVTEATGYKSETSHQVIRLESINLYSQSDDAIGHCPLCSNKLDGRLPSVDIINKSILDLKKSLEPIEKEKPTLGVYIKGLEKEKDEIKLVIHKIQNQIDGILKDKYKVKKIHDDNIIRGKIIGRISLWLENVPEDSRDLGVLKKEIEVLEGKIHELENDLSLELISDKLISIMNIIGNNMTNWANHLNLEHSGYPIRYDYSKNIIVADAPKNPIPLERIGGGENWVGYHIIVLFALHEHFVNNSRPVPRFIFLDQPSQIYYPADLIDHISGSTDDIIDEDRESLDRLYQYIFDFIKGIDGLQIIITDHAYLAHNTEFVDNIVERWRGGKALIPQSWIEDG
ncbi:MAG: DUF3732 domain-containing protein [Candidatus Peribacteraceae bacterium]|nr:DUF3732 domain-containing protein [Candidatus Peribacteraceae bacterium]